MEENGDRTKCETDLLSWKMVNCRLWRENGDICYSCKANSYTRITRVFFSPQFEERDSFFSDLFSAYELKGCQQLTSAPVPSANLEPGQTGGTSQGGLAHTAAQELISTLHI